MFGVRTMTPVLNKSGHPMSGAAEKGWAIAKSSSGALYATTSASMYTSLLN